MATAQPTPTKASDPTDDLTSILFPTGDQPEVEEEDELEQTDPEADEADEVEEDDHEEGEPEEKTPEEAEETDEVKEEDEGADEKTESEDSDETKTVRAKFTEAQQKLFDKAIGKKSRRIVELRTEAEVAAKRLATVEAELEEVRTQAKTPMVATRESPLADIVDEAGLERIADRAYELRSWARRHPEGGSFGDQEIPAEKVVDLLDDAEAMIERHVPKRREWLRQRAEAEVAAVRAVPALKDKTSEVSVAVEAFLRKHGHERLRDLTEARLLLADFVAGRKARISQATKPVAGKTVKASPAPVGGQQRAPKVSHAQKGMGAMKNLENTGQDPGNAALSALIFRRP